MAASSLFAQPEVYPWGNISGIRMDGELMELNTSLGLAGPAWPEVSKTAKEKARYHFRREGNTRFTSISMDPFHFDQSVESLGGGVASVRINFRSETDTVITGAFLIMELPDVKYGDATIQLIDPTPGPIDGGIPAGGNEILRGSGKGLSIKGRYRDLRIEVNEGTSIIARKDFNTENSPVELFFALMTGPVEKGTSAFKSFSIRAGGVADVSPLVVTLDSRVAGRPFKGFGGNFRLQYPDTDPAVIQYCLENMEVRWGRVEMPWSLWQPDMDGNPVEKAMGGELHPHVKASMEMGARLNELGMPVILSAWSAPDWAIVGPRSWRPQPGGLRGNPLDQSKMELIYKSIGDYIQYVKDQYCFDFAMFSFNESDLGINVRQTAGEHAAFIKGLGAYLESRGLKTRLLLGDTADADGWPFVEEAIRDKSTHPYIGAVSFHSWRGYTDENLTRWADAAQRMNLPLLVGEGSMDAGAHRYPDIFLESTYAMEEMRLYTRILKICQPEAILQWQLTTDYSPMTGGGVYGKSDIPLTPTQRFWNFKQMADVPENLFFMPVEADRENVICAALGDNDQGIYAIHIVNSGASRQATLKGLPLGIHRVKVFVTNENNNMSLRATTWVRNGEARFQAESNSFITLIADGEAPQRGF